MLLQKGVSWLISLSRVEICGWNWDVYLYLLPKGVGPMGAPYGLVRHSCMATCSGLDRGTRT